MNHATGKTPELEYECEDEARLAIGRVGDGEYATLNAVLLIQKFEDAPPIVTLAGYAVSGHREVFTCWPDAFAAFRRHFSESQLSTNQGSAQE